MPLMPRAVSLRRHTLTLEIDNDISRYLKTVAEFFPPSIERDVLCQIMSVILYAVISRDSAAPFEAFEHIVAKCDLHTESVRLGDRVVRKEELAWTHFMQLSNLFTVRYTGSKEFAEDLKDLLGEDERGPAEELFHVTISRDWRLMQIS